MSQRPMTTTERNLVIRALSALKAKTHPTTPEWSQINRLWDAIMKGEV